MKNKNKAATIDRQMPERQRESALSRTSCHFPAWDYASIREQKVVSVASVYFCGGGGVEPLAGVVPA
jgi:hypothetical protein